MQLIIKIIQNNPEFISFLFIIINALWFIFVYFNKKKHERNLEILKNNLSLEKEKEKIIFEKRIEMYYHYYTLFENFSKKNVFDQTNNFLPIQDKFIKNISQAQLNNSTGEILELVKNFFGEISNLMSNIKDDYNRLNSETNKLRLISSDRIIELLNNLEITHIKLFELSNKIISIYPELFFREDNQSFTELKNQMKDLSIEVNNDAKKLLSKMRAELLELSQ